ncbi:unnamed protein product, partial [marine sediment metagenome]
MLGGAMISAPLVEEVLDNCDVTNEKKTLINYWYRHVWEYTLPLYPGIILTSGLLNINFSTLILYNIPLTLLAISAGVLFLFDLKRKNPKTFSEKSKKRIFLNLFIGLSPILAVIVGVTIFKINIIIVLAIVITALLILFKDYIPEIHRDFDYKKYLSMLVLVFGLMLFKDSFIESGSGKTTTGRLVLGLTEPTEGKIFFDNIDISSLSPSEMRNFRKKMQIIFQDPYASLNPRMKIGDSIGHSLLIHKICNAAEKRELVLDIMTKVGLTPSKILCEKYPHQLSGGQRQRTVIARALILQPELIVADEPIAMADVSVRATLLKLMMDLKNDFNLTYLFITHDLATTKYICDRIAIMYLGKIFEMGT